MTEGMDDKTVFQEQPQGSLRPGVRLNDMFEIERLIAQGGMGEVYKGVSVASGDAVAIKLVRPDMARHPDVIALFKREAAILHNLLHDAIVRYYVFSIEPELQRAYIAMEFVDGVSLQKQLLAGPMAPADVRVLLRRIGGALEVAHVNGIVHRDISSDNIILPNSDPRRAKIVDFGIARASATGEGTILGDGFAGKYKYVSPEQLGLAGGHVTPKSDIYSFGLVIAEALRGKPLDMGGTQADVIEKRRTVPDLSGIDVSLRPLLTAMLAPNPDDRPADMAEVASWGETGERTQVAVPSPAPAPTPAPRKRTPLVLAAFAAVLALGAATFYFRDAWLGGNAPTPAPTVLPRLPPPPTEAALPSPTPTLAPSPTASATPAPPATPSLQGLLEELPPKPLVAEVALGPFRVGEAVHAELPSFADPGGKGLALHAAPEAPAGLALHDLGGGRASLEGAATTPGLFVFEVVAVNHNGKSARTKVTLTLVAAPPQPAQASLDLEPATLGTPYSAGLPPFRSSEILTLRAERPPAGLAFADLGGGLSQLAGRPEKVGHYEFDVVARTPTGLEGRMRARIDVRPAATTAQTPEPQPTPTSAAPAVPTMAAFLSAFANEPCFAVHPAVEASGAFEAIGADRAAFARFEAAYRAAFHQDPELRAQLVTPSQCPVAKLMNPAPASASGAPRLMLDSTEVGTGKPLSGAVTGLAGRSLLLLAVTDGGRAVKVRVQASPGGDAAAFNLGLSGDADSFGKPQILLAVVSDRPLAGFEAFRAGASTDVLGKIGAQWREAGAAAAVALFKLVE